MPIIGYPVKNISDVKIACFVIGYEKIQKQTQIHGNIANNFRSNYENNIKKNIIPLQLVVHQLQIDMDDNYANNSIILPVYNPSNDIKNIIPVDMSQTANFFNELETQQTSNGMYPFFSTKDNIKLSNKLDDNLHVHDVGDYKITLVPSKKYFINNVDGNITIDIHNVAKLSIEQHSNDYSFIIYEFVGRGKIKILPFGYICPLLHHSKLFIPTINGQPCPDDEQYNERSFVYNSSVFQNNSKYDNEIFIIHVVNATENIKLNISDCELQKINNISIFLNRYIKKDLYGNDLKILLGKKSKLQKINLNGIKSNRNIIVENGQIKFLFDLLIDKNLY
jgi:hypothetical protein